MTQNLLVGTWKLITLESRSTEGPVLYLLGPGAKGYLIYSADGHVSVTMMSAERPQFSSRDVKEGTLAEKAAAFETFIAYCGTYTIHGDQVIHHIEICSLPNWIGLDEERFFELKGNQLTIRAPTLLVDGIQRDSYAIWERV